MYFGYTSYPYAIPVQGEEIPIHRAEKKKSEDVQQILTKHMSIAEEVQRRIASIDERFARIEKMIQERTRRNP